MSFQGTVQTIETKSGQGRRGPWTLYKMQIDGKWYSYGFEAPPAKQGDYVTFEAVNEGKGYNITKGSLKVTAAPAAGARAETGQLHQRIVESQDTRQMSIVMQHSQEMAVRHVANLLSASALSLSGTGKASEAKRFAELAAITDKLTVKFYNDATTGRLLKSVADTEPSTAPDAPIPTPKKAVADDDLGDE